MKINEVGISAKAIDPRPEVQTPSAAVSAAVSTTNAASSADATAFVLSPEIRRWLNLLRDQPEVRAEAIQRAAEKLAKGHYNRPEIAEQLAEALLNAID